MRMLCGMQLHTLLDMQPEKNIHITFIIHMHSCGAFPFEVDIFFVVVKL